MLIIDDFLSDSDLSSLLDNKDKLFSNQGVYHWWPGWQHRDSGNVHEHLIELIHLKYKPLYNNYKWDLSDPSKHIDSNYPDGIVGFEYWANAGHPNWHVTRDESRKDTYITPPLSVILYLEVPSEGGELEVSTKSCKEYGEPFTYEPLAAVLKPVANRLIVMDPSYWHRVRPVVNQNRYTLVHDIWHQKIGTTYK